MDDASGQKHQFDLFSGDQAPPAVGAAAVSDSLARLAPRLPALLRLGTSSWSFPGWKDLVYDRSAPAATLAHEGLGAYARHPLLRTVGVDRTYYAPMSAEEWAAYAAAVPEGFRFLTKAHVACTRARDKGEVNPLFLDPDYAVEQVVRPFMAGCRESAGVILFQFPPQPLQPRDFVSRLERFLRALPEGPLYAVEVRNRELLTADYFRVLTDCAVSHCYLVHPRVPDLLVQERLAQSSGFPALILRWVLHGGLEYEQARRRYRPFDKIVDQDDANRRAIVDLCLRAAARRQPAYVIANNKAEGSAPLSLFQLARALVA